MSPRNFGANEIPYRYFTQSVVTLVHVNFDGAGINNWNNYSRSSVIDRRMVTCPSNSVISLVFSHSELLVGMSLVVALDLLKVMVKVIYTIIYGHLDLIPVVLNTFSYHCGHGLQTRKRCHFHTLRRRRSATFDWTTETLLSVERNFRLKWRRGWLFLYLTTCRRNGLMLVVQVYHLSFKLCHLRQHRRNISLIHNTRRLHLPTIRPFIAILNDNNRWIFVELILCDGPFDIP